MKSTTCLLFLFFLIGYLYNDVHGQGLQEVIDSKPSPLRLRTEESCSSIVATHTFEGTCCSLFGTETGGCELAVINGNCKVTGGDVWFLDFTSVYALDDCPKSDYIVTPTMAPSSQPSMMTSSTSGPTSTTSSTTTTLTRWLTIATITVVSLIMTSTF